MTNSATPDPRRKRSSAKGTSRAERARSRWLTESHASGPRAGAPPQPPAPQPIQPVKPRLRVGVILLYPLVLLSLGLNVILIQQLLQAQDMVYTSLDQVVAMTDDIENLMISIPIHIDEEFPVSVSVPFEYSATFPINMDVPIKTTFTVPFDIMDQTINFKVPVDMSIPINLDVPVSLEKTFDISTTVPVKFDVLVEVSLADTPLPEYLSALRSAIQELKQ